MIFQALVKICVVKCSSGSRIFEEGVRGRGGGGGGGWVWCGVVWCWVGWLITIEIVLTIEILWHASKMLQWEEAKLDSTLNFICRTVCNFIFITVIFFRAARPLLTMYICLESAQQNSGMKEYYAMFLDALSLGELRKKLALKCNLSMEQIVAVYR